VVQMQKDSDHRQRPSSQKRGEGPLQTSAEPCTALGVPQEPPSSPAVNSAANLASQVTVFNLPYNPAGVST
jgi:hypothetical protein